ncbi:MAG: CapA family protein [Mariniphaga sp.]|nr:CapA family protein [Mariniphaga sp.]
MNKDFNSTIQLLIGADICPIGRNLPFFQLGEATALFNDLLPEFESADLSIVNLECPLIQDESPIKKIGPVLGAPTTCVNGLKASGINIVNLANNHIMDHGSQGLETTLETLKKNGIAYFGAGMDLFNARKIIIHKIKNKRIGFIGLAEHEFGIAERNKSGSNPLDVIDFVRNVNNHCSKFDYLIVLVHGGNEHYQYPRPNLIETCRFLVEQGANAVICQHSHCVGCMETYKGAPINYGQGNLLMDMPSKYETWYEGILVSLEIETLGDCEIQIKLIPYRQSDEQPGAKRMSPEQEVRFLYDFKNRSKSFQDESFVISQWDNYCRNHRQQYLNMLHGKSNLLRKILGRLDLLHYLESKVLQRKRLHLIRCESHREAIINVLDIESSK